MAKKGIKSIKHTAGNFHPEMSGRKLVVIYPNATNTFEVAEWEPGTTDKDKNNVSWLLEDDRRNEVKFQLGNKGSQCTLSIPPKMCGINNTYYVEATFDAHIDRSTDTGLYVRGYVTPAIVSSQWQDKNRAPLAKDKPISFGDDVILHMVTQGLCKSRLLIKVYHRNWGSDVLIDTFSNVACTDGEVNVQIQNTHEWYAKVWHISQHEFYVTVESSSNDIQGLIKDTTAHGDTFHARYLRIDNTLLNVPKTLPAKNVAPAKSGENELNLKKYDPCGFSHIEVKDGDDRVVLFDEGKLHLKNEVHKDFDISEMIHYDFDKSNIRADAKPVLNKIATFLLESPYVPVELGSHTDAIGGDDYNMKLSDRRAQSAVKYLIDYGIAADRIVAKGYGKTRLLSQGHTDEDNQQNRRTTIRYRIYSNDAQAIIYETLAGDSSHKRKIDVTIKDFKIDGCIMIGDKKHTTKIKVVEQTSLKDDTNPKYELALAGEQIHPEIYGNLANVNTFPFYYIWPIAVATDNFLFYINSCRYFSNKQKPSVVIRVYPDIKWTLTFFLNLTNDLSIKWMNMSKDKAKELQSKAGKIGAERRWQQKDASFGFSLKTEWNKVGDTYTGNNEIKKSFDTKIKRLYDLFSSIANIADGITNVTKGGIKGSGMSNFPITFEVKPPNVNISATWMLQRAHQKKSAIERVGTQISVTVNAQPLIGLDITIDLLGAAVGVIAGAVSEGAATDEALRIYHLIKSRINDGASVGNDDLGAIVKGDVYIDLILSGTISTNFTFNFNTVSDGSDTAVKLETSAKITATLKAGANTKASFSAVAVKVTGYFEASASGSGSITFGHSLNADDTGLYYRPQLGFDGIDVQYTLVGKVNLSTTKIPNASDDHTLFNKTGKSTGLVPKFDVIKSLEEVSGLSADIYIVRNENNTTK